MTLGDGATITARELEATVRYFGEDRLIGYACACRIDRRRENGTCRIDREHPAAVLVELARDCASAWREDTMPGATMLAVLRAWHPGKTLQYAATVRELQAGEVRR